MRRRAFLLVLALATNAEADVDVRDLAVAIGSSTGAPPRRSILARPNMSALIEIPEGDDPGAFGLPRVGSHFSVASGSIEELANLATAHPTWRVTWSAPLRLFSDRAAAWTRAPDFRNDTGLTGKGVIVGIIDAGFDVAHPDLRNPDGTTRIAYFVDFSQKPLFLHPELETLCLENASCRQNAESSRSREIPYAVLTAADINEMLAVGDRAPIPTDPEGHGTHVASLAAGNGGPEQKYAGVAPQASLIAVKASNADGFIDNAVIPVAAAMVFSLAERAAKAAGVPRIPTVVNLSLGTDFGNHDGTSALEKSLSELVGRDHPGRVIVAAAGNSAGLFDPRSAYPAPLGIHTEVNLPPGSSLRVPIVTQAFGETRPEELSGAILVWITFRPGDEISVGLDKNDGPIVVPQRPGSIYERTDGDLTIDIVNRALSAARISPEDKNAAAVILSGSWPVDRTFAIRLEGHGTASLWVQTTPPLREGSALFPAATKESTIAIPAASPAVIAVGATLNRTDWVDRNGSAITLPSFGGLKSPEPDSIVFFSGAGPTADLRMKPDIVAPGAFVVGAMSAQADPVGNLGSVFAGSPLCDDVDEDCTVVDDEHAVLTGTSMAAPIVTGAVALLLEEKPDRTQDEMLTLLQAGARFPRGLVRTRTQLGAGALDLEGILDVEREIATPNRRSASSDKSWLNLGATFAHPDPSWRIPAVVELRDENGRVADVSIDELAIVVDRGTVTERLERAAPGFYRFAVTASDGTGGDTLRVAVVNRGITLLSQEMPIAVDINVARGGFSARGGCSMKPASPPGAAFLAAGALLFTAWTSRRRRNVARTVRSLGRTDTSDRYHRGSSQK